AGQGGAGLAEFAGGGGGQAAGEPLDLPRGPAELLQGRAGLVIGFEGRGPPGPQERKPVRTDEHLTDGTAHGDSTAPTMKEASGKGQPSSSPGRNSRPGERPKASGTAAGASVVVVGILRK